jgi:predicted enzyme related to lactoylglutathione lyase
MSSWNRERRVPKVLLEIADIIIDCSDAEAVATFWAELLDRPIAGRKGPYVWLERNESGVGVGFQRVEEPKRTKNRVHLDIGAADLERTKDRVEALGGHRVEGFETGGFLVMADPEDNEFCLVPMTQIHLDDHGNTNYLDGLDI